ncbi:hypothetical protein JQ557_26180 [Bradyrhizobium sp. U87765 SZCCT0131]|uniref:hypothetical protein n=1 Tax=unclassified Bradyrhizobium TaxID=2631580 RepID=UPI001BA875EB|nr:MULTISPECIES: hypothetical protein [unclassified Bradyrhizobium]MBR1221514.1 hypothetical protein [Bradyrhizobium sp. U87765 SZCCT0131]MBR1264563.1 hypothetical protein [Bradyrhizobium sp. U87765 SZCCT0134]MBR1304531.1 hypothetical protein [Bradyrhizobium sp. U87765 SZCCT0110]MBR1322612.1 hypothetical protein [Bradyrhizobium sp. U87765 SZCCT0109]MBR1346460.1 hypothetical protein [Bradyrhizobium sp. U87765 SZCCT0048]
MNRNDRIVNKAEAFNHPALQYASPNDVLNDATLSIDEKRALLSSWASDAYAVESQPGLREVPGVAHRLRLADILAALKQLGEDTDPPPRGGLAMRLPRLHSIEGGIIGAVQRASDRHAINRRTGPRPVVGADKQLRWTRDANIRRYRQLLTTQLTEIERDFVQRRLHEELLGAGRKGALQNSADRGYPPPLCG